MNSRIYSLLVIICLIAAIVLGLRVKNKMSNDSAEDVASSFISEHSQKDVVSLVDSRLDKARLSPDAVNVRADEFALAEARIANIVSAAPELKSLDARARSLLAKAYADAQAIRKEFEIALVERVGFDGHELRLKISPYPRTGKKIMEIFYGELKKGLSADDYSLVIDELGESFYLDFAGFGEFEQLYTITKEDNEHDAKYRVVRKQIAPTSSAIWDEVKSGKFVGREDTAAVRDSRLSFAYRSIAENIRSAFGT